MKLNLIQQKSYRIIIGLILVFGFLVTESSKLAAAEKPEIPLLSLTGSDNRWDEKVYPDGRIWLPASINEPREFLLPVFIKNKWRTYDDTKDIYVADPIKSFSFTVLYDSSAIRAVGVQKFGPMELYFGDATAKNFNISWMDKKDWSYRTYLNPNTPPQDYQKGRAITITGTSTIPLENNDDWKILLYIRFKIIPKDGFAIGTAGFTPIYIKNDTIMYNDLNICKNAPFEKLRNYDNKVGDDYPNPTKYTGLMGVKNGDPDDESQNTIKWPNEPMLPGVIYLRISDRVPMFGYTLERGVGTVPAISEVSPELWDMADPLTLDSASFEPFIARRIIQIRNNTATSRLLEVEIESDQPWLKFRTVRVSVNSKDSIPQPTYKGRLNWIDNGILGDAARGTPYPGVETNPDGDVHLEIRCDPTLLQPSEGEMAGLYVGYLTFKSHTAAISPVRLRITFIHFRLPYEPSLYDVTGTRTGIRLLVRNSRGATGDVSKLIFGTGHRATNGVDSLFGEYAQDVDFKEGEFEARWFPPDAVDAPGPQWDEIRALLSARGYGDFAPDDDNNDGSPKRSNSRDIRNINDTMQSIIYKCRVNENTAANYPLVLEWDIADFPDGASLFLRDTLNGALFPSVNMRTATALGPTKRSYVISDPRVKSFLIEYTLPRVINYVDEFGNPIIKKGWNLLSLPVRPINTTWNVVYPNAINIPYYFSQNQYQQPDAGILKVGVGYYIKYGTNVDKQFAGTYIPEVDYVRDPIRVYPGWNTIGALSVPLNAREVAFSQFLSNLPTQNFTRRFGVWGYKTDKGFYEVSELRPGLGYWIKCDADGYLKLKNPRYSDDLFDNFKNDVIKTSDKISISDNSGNSSQVYISNNSTVDLSNFELPPVPPADLFDIRFETGNYVDNSGVSVVKLQGVTYPVVINIPNASAKYILTDAATGEYLGSISEGSNGSVIIKSELSNAIKIQRNDILTGDFGVSNYPNPVNNNTTVQFSIEQNDNVMIKLYDAMGNEIATLANGFFNSGVHSVPFNASNLANGKYIIKMVSGLKSSFGTMTVVK